MSLRSLGGDVTPPPHLKPRVVRDLRRRGVLPPRAMGWRAMAALLAGVGVFGAGYALGRAGAETAAGSTGAPRYALLLYEDSAFDRSQAEAALVAEYRAWGGQLVAAGHDVSGEKLGFEVGIVNDGAAGPGQLTGFFIVSAANDSAALAVARGSPHRRHNGRVVVRRVDPT